MKKKNKLAINTVVGLIQQIVTVINGLIVPKMILMYYGSETNGLISSITQFLSLISLCELGVGAVVQSSLYKPLEEQDNVKISQIVVSANRFFRKIALILLVYVCVLAFAFPYISSSSFDSLFSAALVVIIAINSFSQYYFGITYKLLLNSSQLCYVHMIYNIAGTIISAAISVGMMALGYGIHMVKLAGAVIFLIPPILVNIYVAKHFSIDKKVVYTGEPIKQKWNGLAQHFATVIFEHTDTVVLTVFSTLENVSVYAVYHMVINGIRQLIISTMSGVKSFLGSVYAKNDEDTVKRIFAKIEWCTHTVVALLFSVMGVLIIPFVSVYTANITDAEYIVPLFAFIMVAAQGIYCIRFPYNFMIQAIGHYRETQISAIIEVAINVAVSVVLVARFGLVGVAIGTFVSMTYRTVYMAWYLSKKILHRSLGYFFLHIVVDVLSVLITVLLTYRLEMRSVTYLSWIFLAIQVFFICTAVIILLNVVFYRKNIKWLWSSVFKSKRKKV